MRYRTGPIAGTIILTALALSGVYGLITVGFGDRSVGSSIFGLVVIALFAAFAAVGLNELRGLRTDRRPDGSTALLIPRLVPTGGRWWTTVPRADIDSIDLVRVGRRGKLYELAVTLRDGSVLAGASVAVNVRWRGDPAGSRAADMVEAIRRDLGMSHA